jgi:hypothetical protein
MMADRSASVAASLASCGLNGSGENGTDGPLTSDDTSGKVYLLEHGIPDTIYSFGNGAGVSV